HLKYRLSLGKYFKINLISSTLMEHSKLPQKAFNTGQQDPRASNSLYGYHAEPTFLNKVEKKNTSMTKYTAEGTSSAQSFSAPGAEGLIIFFIVSYKEQFSINF
ncbi:unnamed protein product, partial [Owenia fusiformis]